jgi:competence protein ComEA
MAVADLNKSDFDTLRQVEGINSDLAEAIIAFRERSGPFAGPEDLDRMVPFQALSETQKAAIRSQVTAAPTVTVEETKRHRPPVDINTATLDELTRIRALGEGRAKAIIAWRDSHHGFRSVDEIDAIPEFADALPEERDHIKGYLTI